MSMRESIGCMLGIIIFVVFCWNQVKKDIYYKENIRTLQSRIDTIEQIQKNMTEMERKLREDRIAFDKKLQELYANEETKEILQRTIPIIVFDGVRSIK